MSDETEGGAKLPNANENERLKKENEKLKKENEKLREVNDGLKTENEWLWANRASDDPLDAAVKGWMKASEAWKTRAGKAEAESERLKEENEKLTEENLGLRAGWLNKNEVVWVEDATGSTSWSNFLGEKTVPGHLVVKLHDEMRVISASDLDALRARAEHAESRLAGVLVAAEGYATDGNDSRQDDYGWSPAFDKVKELRAEVERLREGVLAGEDLDTFVAIKRAAVSLCEVIREDTHSFLRIDMARKWLNLELVLRTGKGLE